ncbi:PI-PLC X domain-containing protein 1-like [Uloborus diversus]|uniref:PI-PLC X domain-containing protein 1-like n=1 Tax=Uloborus diversus TaxID=327109 RepID=UPI00240A72BE|nr:PI-PLC X domain-containing protein 1-like [Uloborus diversus]
MGFPFVGLYSANPTEYLPEPLALHMPTDCPEGRIETNYSIPEVQFDKNTMISGCLGLWAAYVEAGKVAHSSCLRTYPNWMYDMRKEIGDKRLSCLMIPGTHNSGCYLKYSPMRDTLYHRYVYTQEENVFNQLVYGIRFLDLRVWHERSILMRSKIKITHDWLHFNLPTLEDILQQVKDFLLVTNEVVILDFHRLLSGTFRSRILEKWQHKEILSLLKNTFGDLLLESGDFGISLNSMWRMGKRVLILYRDNKDLPSDQKLALNVYHWWESFQFVNDLHKHLVENVCMYEFYGTAAVAVLTPTEWTPIFDVTYSRRRAAYQVNTMLHTWFRNELSCSNIILTDYFLGNNVIQVSIDANKNSSRCSTCLKFCKLMYSKKLQ